MGAGQSSDNGASTPVAVKTSYYELLSIERQATDDEIKRAYRRKALELHPDRNHGREEEATRLFAEIQAAYEVLSDPQERAWYDAHESEILRGDDGGAGEDGAHFEANIKVTTTHDIAKMMKKFNRNIDFSDKPTGFFGFLREFFEQLAKEEEAAARWQGEEPRDYPSFGHKDDSYDGVVKAFYASWSGFSTQKSFGWTDKWRLSDAPDRQVRRLMEKENAQVRKEAIREFNDAVRQLVSFVRKRDPRYNPVVVSDAERQKSLRDAAAAQAAKARAENEAKLKTTDAVPDWAKVREPDEIEEEDEEEEDLEEYECVACRKSFKSENQFEAHERSKKHQKAVQALKRKMRKDNVNLHLDETASSDGITPMSDEEPVNTNIEDTGDHDVEPDTVEELTGEVEALDVRDDDKASNTAKKAEEGELSEDNDSSDTDDEYAERSEITSRLSTENTSTYDSLDHDLELDPLKDKQKKASQEPKMGAAAKKRAKKAAQAAAIDSEELKFKCAMCNSAFPSKTRLFQHIKDNGHAALKSDVGGGKGKKGKR